MGTFKIGDRVKVVRLGGFNRNVEGMKKYVGKIGIIKGYDHLGSTVRYYLSDITNTFVFSEESLELAKEEKDDTKEKSFKVIINSVGDETNIKYITNAGKTEATIHRWHEDEYDVEKCVKYALEKVGIGKGIEEKKEEEKKKAAPKFGFGDDVKVVNDSNMHGLIGEVVGIADMNDSYTYVVDFKFGYSGCHSGHSDNFRYRYSDNYNRNSYTCRFFDEEDLELRAKHIDGICF